MIDNTSHTTRKEPRNWTSIILAIAVHALLIGALWIGAMRHNAGSGTPGEENHNAVLASNAAEANSTASAVASSLVQPPARETTPTVLADRPAPESTKAETKSSDAAYEQSVKSDLAEKKRSERTRLAALKRKNYEKHVAQLKIQAAEKDLARQHERQRSDALALQIKRKKEKGRSELLVKQHAELVAIKAAAQAARQKELDESRSIENLRQKELQRITKGLTGADGNGSS